jgi:hypothetical protein
MPSDLNDPTHEPLFLGHVIYGNLIQIERTSIAANIKEFWIKWVIFVVPSTQLIYFL